MGKSEQHTLTPKYNILRSLVLLIKHNFVTMEEDGNKLKITSQGCYKCNIYQVECRKCDAIYIGNTQKTFKKRMDGHFSELLCLLKNRQKSDSFSAHFVQHFNTTTSHTELPKFMTFKVLGLSHGEFRTTHIDTQV